MVIEDEENLLKLVSVNLAARGYQVTEGKNGTEALAHLHVLTPVLLVLDIKLPDFTGWELLKKMKLDPGINTDFPVIVMTASINDAYVDINLFPNVEEVLIKPFSIPRLISAIKQALSHAERK